MVILIIMKKDQQIVTSTDVRVSYPLEDQLNYLRSKREGSAGEETNLRPEKKKGKTTTIRGTKKLSTRR